MKLAKTLFLTAFTICTLGVSAQTADEIIVKHIEAMGGKDKLTTLKSVRMTGSMNSNGTDITITNSKVHNVGLRVDLDIMGTANYQLVNKKSGWVFFPVMGMSDPKEMDAEQYKGAMHQLDLQGAFYNYKEKGSTVEMLGKEMVDGSEAYKLKVNFSNGYATTYYIDTKTNRIVKSVSKSMANGQEVEIQSTLADYRATADGYWFPHSVTSQQGTIVWDKIEPNVAINESIFTN